MNDTGLNKWDWIALATGVVGMAAGIFGSIAGFKAGSARADQLNKRLEPSLRNPPQQQ